MNICRYTRILFYSYKIYILHIGPAHAHLFTQKLTMWPQIIRFLLSCVLLLVYIVLRIQVQCRKNLVRYEIIILCYTKSTHSKQKFQQVQKKHDAYGVCVQYGGIQNR